MTDMFLSLVTGLFGGVRVNDNHVAGPQGRGESGQRHDRSGDETGKASADEAGSQDLNHGTVQEEPGCWVMSGGPGTEKGRKGP